MLHLQREIQSLGEQLQQHNHVICELQRRLLESGVPMADIMDLRNDGTKVRSDSPTTPKITSPLTKSFWKSRQKRGR